MSSSKYNNGGMGLTLSCAQTGTPASTARQNSARSSARGSQSSLTGIGARPKTTDTSNGRPRSSSFDRNAPNSLNTPKSQRSKPSSSRSNGSTSLAAATSATATDDFLALFDSITQPKILQPKSKTKSTQPKKAWGSTQNSARSGASTSSKHSGSTAHGSKFSHSVFEPISARTNSTVDEDDAYQDYMHRNYEHTTDMSQRETKSTNHIHTTPRVKGDHNLHLAIPESVGRNSGHGENDLFRNSKYDSSDKATKLNSIANNMTSMAHSPSTKAPFHGMVNSYQNIKHKQPVNQVKQSSSSQQQNKKGAVVGRNRAEDYIKKCNMAATQIQRWFRRHSSTSSKAGDASLRRILQKKMKEKTEEMECELHKDPGEKRRRTRKERAHQERMEAIEELQKKRESKRQHNQEVVAQEMTFLQASGNVSKMPSGKSNVKKKSSPMVKSSPRANTAEEPTEVQSLGGRSPVSAAEETGASGDMSGRDGQDTEVPSHSGTTKTTLDDLMETLQQLQADDQLGKESGRKEKNEKPLAWPDELEKHSNAEDNGASGGGDVDKDNIRKSSSFLSDEKLKNVMSYLNEVSTADRLSEIDQELSKSTEALFYPPMLVPSHEELAAIEQASVNAAEVTNSMLTQKMELEAKRRSVEILQKSLNQQRELTLRHAKDTEKEMKKQLALQDAEFDSQIQHKNEFIDRLMDDKKYLAEQCEKLANDIKTMAKKSGDKIKVMTNSHDVKLKSVSQICAAKEKINREKWKVTETARIEENTKKGLLPELETILAQHKSEIQRLKSVHSADLLAADGRSGGRYTTMIEEMRDQLAKEKEAACARERELARQTYETQMRQEEEAYQQQRRRMYAEVQEEKERQAQQASRQRMELDRMQREQEDTHSSTLATMREEFERSRDDYERRHTSEIRHLEEQVKLEKAAWQENYTKKQETWALQRERELKDSVRQERDREIDLVIQRLEGDNQSSRDESERVAENRIKRIRDQYEAQMTELERSERVTMQKYNENKAALAEFEGENERHKVVMRQKDIEVEDIKKLLEKLNSERDRVSDVIRQEFADRIVTTDEENKRFKNEMSEQKARHRLELEKSKVEVENMTQQKQEEMDMVHSSVKKAVEVRDKKVKEMKQQYDAAVKRADHLESLLAQQRKQLLGAK